MLERRFPYNPGQGLFRTGFWTDFILYCLVQSYVLGLVNGFPESFPAGYFLQHLRIFRRHPE